MDGDDLSDGAWSVDDAAALRRFWPHGRFYSSDLEPFSGRVFRRRLPHTRVEGISASPYACQRSEEALAASSGDELVVSAIIEGSATIHGLGRTLTVRPGDVFVHRLTPFEYRCPVFSRTFRTASPPSLVMGRAWTDFAPFAVLPRTVLTHAFVRFAAEVLHSVAERPAMLERDSRVLEEALLVLERALVSELMEAEAGLLRHDERLRLLTERYIETNLLESDLDPTSIADALAVSRRSLYAAFRDEPEGIAFSIRRRRMEVAGTILEREHAIAVAHLAARVGIPNSDTFARAFKAHHGLTVAQARQRARISGERVLRRAARTPTRSAREEVGP